MEPIYLDNAASTRVSDDVVALMTDVMKSAWGNPSAQHPQGDFLLQHGRVLPRPEGTSGLTYSGMALLHPALFAGCPAGKFPLKAVLLAAMATGRVSGECYGGDWEDVGTPERLHRLNARVAAG